MSRQKGLKHGGEGKVAGLHCFPKEGQLVTCPSEAFCPEQTGSLGHGLGLQAAPSSRPSWTFSDPCGSSMFCPLALHTLFFSPPPPSWEAFLLSQVGCLLTLFILLLQSHYIGENILGLRA